VRRRGTELIEHLAGVEDFEVAQKAYRAADLRPELVYKLPPKEP